MSVIVFGSVNMDLVAQVPRLPRSGETLLGHDFVTTPGGKGANQAVALAKLGVPTQMVGRVGGDSFGAELLAALQAAQVNTDNIQVDPATHSGVALITVAATGENQIIGVFGANARVDATDVQRLQPLLKQATLLLMQLEIPLAAVQLAAQAAQTAGVPVILDPAPVPATSLDPVLPLVDILTPNEVEAGQLVGFPVTDAVTAEQAAIALQQRGARTVIVKLAAQGVFYRTAAGDSESMPAFAVNAIDTVAAGDAFAGGLAAALVAGLPLRQAVIWGCGAGALATTRRGAQVAMGDRAELAALLQAQPR